METYKMNDFVADTEGNCFLCLSQIKTGASSSIKCSIYSVQDLSQYLKLNRGKVFHEKDGIPQELLDKVENARLKVELCPMCGLLTGQFSKLFRLLEKVEMEIGDCLNHIQKRMKGAVGKTAVNYNSIGCLMGKQEIVEVLRSEVIEKCSRSADTRRPRVKIENLSLRKVKAMIVKRKSRNRRTGSKAVSIEGFSLKADWSDCNSEEMDLDNTQGYLEQGQDISIATSFQDTSRTSNEPSGNAQQPFKMTELTKNPAPVTVRKILNIDKAIDGKSQSTVNPETGNHKCSLCEKEFKQLSNFYTHYKSAHLKEKYSCNSCGKEFLHKRNWYRHNKIAHLGIRFKCNGCGKLFQEKAHLMGHLGKSPSSSCKKERSPNDERKGTSTNDNVLGLDHVDNVNVKMESLAK